MRAERPNPPYKYNLELSSGTTGAGATGATGTIGGGGL